MARGETYEQFVDKFKPKKTTDDCYTPEPVYEAVKGWACREYGIDPADVVRPFWPGGDYERLDYPEGCAVIDNPPFSMLAAICRFYLDRGVPFFLFAPSLTCLSGADTCMRMNHLVTDCAIVYANGAEVRTSFVTNMGDPDTVLQSAPGLTRAVNAAVESCRERRSMPKYAYPDEVVTAAMVQRYSKYGVEFRVRRGECRRIVALDMQRSAGKAIFGGGLLLGERAAAERAAAERAAAERAAAERWSLSRRELAIVSELRG
jgi:hypothetical protein